MLVQPTNPSSLASAGRFLPLGVKLIVPIVLLTALVTWGAYVGLMRIFQANLLEAKEAAAEMVVSLFSASVAPSVVFDDDTDMQRSVADLARNRDVTDVELWSPPTREGPTQSPPLAEYHRAQGRPGPAPEEKSSRVFLENSLEVVEPVRLDDRKTVAVVRVRFSLAREQAVLTELARKMLYGAVGTAAALTLALLIMLGKTVVIPLGRLKASALSLQAGKRGAGMVAPAGRIEDEVGQLARVFVGMADAVADREAKLALRNSELRLILDNVAQGFLSVSPDGTIQKERSAVVERWVGPLADGARLFDLIDQLDARQTAHSRLGWAQLMERQLPLDMCVAQLPKRAVLRGQHFSLEYWPVVVADEIRRVVVVLSDITAEVERRRVEEQQKELAALVDRLVRDRAGFVGFWRELEGLVGLVIAATPSPSLKRDLHTVKGVSRAFGLWRLSSLCHNLEESLAERRSAMLLPEERQSLEAEWNDIRARVEALTRGASSFLELTEGDYERLSSGLRLRMSHEILAELVSEFHYEPTRRHLERAQETLEAACCKQGKPTAQVVIEDHGVRLPPGRWAGFWSAFGQVLANAADHGIEVASYRTLQGKPANGTIRLSTRVVESDFIIEVEDDGPGIDWDGVRDCARRRGLPYQTQADLEAALLVEGFTTRPIVSELGGRGVGLSVVRHAVLTLGGTIEIVSKSKQGTLWRFIFPVDTTQDPPRQSEKGSAAGTSTQETRTCPVEPTSPSLRPTKRPIDQT